MHIRMDFKPAEKELRASKRCFERMQSARSYEEYEESWCDFLNHLEKIFEKLNRACAPVKGKFSSLISRENMLRSTDPLLQYLKQARNADTHSIQDIAQHIPARYGVGFNLRQGETSAYIEKMRFENGALMEYKGSHPLILTFTPETVVVKEVENQKRRYPPPKTHLGKQLNTLHPTELAKLGIDFYQKLFEKVVANFEE